jgi:small subunit ribosomal protein S6
LRKYELTYLVSDEVPESDLNKVTGKVSGYVKELGGKTTKEEIWGRRKLAYPIKKQDFATYVTLYFDLPANKAIEFEKDLRLIDGVLRQLMIIKELSNEKITLTTEDIIQPEEIAKVTGGEKSFEAVIGETEDSKSLMAKRPEEKVETVEEVKEIETKEIEKKTVTPKAKTLKEKTVEVEKEEIKEEVKEEKPKKVAKKKEETSSLEATKGKKVNDEVERLSKLNDELDDILKDEL